MKTLVIDIDATLTLADTADYTAVSPNLPVVETLRNYKAQGFEIVLFTSRNMRTYNNDVGKITANMLPTLFAWLAKHDIPYDSVVVGKPWCGTQGFYVDDKAIRPSEFLNNSYEEIQALLKVEKDLLGCNALADAF